MSKPEASTTDADGPGSYEIRIKGHLDQRWVEQLEGMAFRLESNGITNLAGPLADQSALHGVLNRIRDLGIPIISVQRVGPADKALGEEPHDRS